MGTIVYEKKNGIAYITLNRPEVLNALNQELEDELYKCGEDFRDDQQCRVAIISANGDKAFCVGADLKQRPSATSRERYPSSLHLLPELWKPVIAAIHGYCLGAGIALVADCDLRIAADDALFGLPEVKLSSLVAFRQQVIRLVGLAPGMYMLLTGENINAQKALNWGLVYDVVPRAELMPAAEKVARIIASNPPLAVTAIKQAVHSETQRTEYVDNIIQSLVHELKNSEDSIEARKAFAEKRRPIWKGR